MTPGVRHLRHRIALAPPAVRRDGATFAWQVEPATALYSRHHFSLRLPAGLDGRRLPASLWWTVGLLCLHSHWNLLRPCTVELPVTLPPGHREFWLRLLISESDTLEAYRAGGAGEAALGADGADGASGADGAHAAHETMGTPGAMGAAGAPGGIELHESGPALRTPGRLAETGLCAAAFSGGKDSLLQAALLAELGCRAILVPTTSPMPPLNDHVTARRRHVLAEIGRRRDFELQEVASDLRSSWRNDFPPCVGYPVAVNEITDTFLYTASLLVVGALRGATHLFLASEAEVQENAEIGGRTVQHTHFMYSAATQAALAALLAPLGMRYGSLISALHSSQVQQLLWTRYDDLRDLQYSCWRVEAGEATCSRCSQCLRLALAALALGDSPERMGVDLVRLFPALRDWQPGGAAASSAGAKEADGTRLPADVVRLGLRRQVLRSLAATPTARVAAALVAGGPRRMLQPAAWRALAAYAHLRRRLVLGAEGGLGGALAEVPGYRAGFLRQVDGLVRARLAEILAAHFDVESEAAYAGVLQRGEALAGWIAAPLTLAALPAVTALPAVAAAAAAASPTAAITTAEREAAA